MYLSKKYFENLINGPKTFNIVRIFIYYFQWYGTVIKKGDGNREYFVVFVLSYNPSYYYRINSVKGYDIIDIGLRWFHVLCKK